MYVIEDKKGRFYSGMNISLNSWTLDLEKSTVYVEKRFAIANCIHEKGERVFEVHLTLGKQVR